MIKHLKFINPSLVNLEKVAVMALIMASVLVMYLVKRMTWDVFKHSFDQM